MKILVDADACPVIKYIERVAMKYDVSVILFSDTNHILSSDYSEIRIVDSGPDSVDFALIAECKPGDIVVTQDYGVASMALVKGAKAIHNSGRRYTDENINMLLMDRHIAKKERARKGHRVKSTPRPNVEGNFEKNFEELLKE